MNLCLVGLAVVSLVLVIRPVPEMAVIRMVTLQPTTARQMLMAVNCIIRVIIKAMKVATTLAT